MNADVKRNKMAAVCQCDCVGRTRTLCKVQTVHVLFHSKQACVRLLLHEQDIRESTQAVNQRPQPLSVCVHNSHLPEKRHSRVASWTVSTE